MKTVEEVAAKVNNAKVHSLTLQMDIGKLSYQKTVKNIQHLIHHLEDINT